MANCAVIDSNNQLVNVIVAEVTDVVPEGFTLVEIPDGYYWDINTQQLQPIPKKK